MNATGRTKRKMELLKDYKFYLAFENTNEKDYVTEKYFQSLKAGAIPVYMGAPNIDDFKPGEPSIIKVSDFESPKALADYLLFLNRTEPAYLKYLDWKIKGPSESFQKLLNRVNFDSRCRLCMKLWDNKRLN